MEKRRFSWRAKTLLVVGTVALILLALPFRPNVAISKPLDEEFTSASGPRQPQVRVTLTNGGALPVWYAAPAGQVLDYGIAGDPSVDQSIQPGHGPTNWSLLWPGDSVAITPTIVRSTQVVRAGITLADWKGRTVFAWGPYLDSVPPVVLPRGPMSGERRGRVRIVAADTLEPVAGCRLETILIGPDGGDGGFQWSVSDEDGVVLLSEYLTPGRYQLYLEPPQDSRYLVTQYAEQDTYLTIKPDWSYSPKVFKVGVRAGSETDRR